MREAVNDWHLASECWTAKEGHDKIDDRTEMAAVPMNATDEY
jgi:hypothetical protein